MKARAEVAAKNIERTRKPVRDHNVRAKEPAEPVPAVDRPDLAAAYRGAARVAARQATRQKSLKAHSERLMEARETRHQQAQDRLQHEKAEHKDRFKHWVERQQ